MTESQTTLERALPCPYCKRAFKSRQDLWNHVRRMRRQSAAHGLDGERIRSREEINRAVAEVSAP